MTPLFLMIFAAIKKEEVRRERERMDRRVGGGSTVCTSTLTRHASVVLQ